MTDTEIINLFFERSEQAIEELDIKHAEPGTPSRPTGQARCGHLSAK